MSGEPLVSVCLGVKNGARTIARFIAAVRAQTYGAVELIIVDNHSDDGTAEICAKGADQFFTLGPERSAQRNKAIREASGEYVLILDADQYLQPGVVAQCVAMMESDRRIHGLFIPEETLAGGFWGACKKFERDFYLIGDPSAEAARFFRRAEVLAVGGFDETQTGSEDWDLSDRMLLSGSLGRIKARIVHDEGFIDLGEQVRKKQYYARSGINDYLRTAPAFRRVPFPFRPSVRKQWKRLVAHPVLAAGTLYMKLREGLSVLTSRTRR
jgi:glycosyltransferase involved in cell wall biosynthesis